MKQWITKLYLTILLLSLLVAPAAEAQGLPPEKEPDSGSVLCIPDVYLSSPDDCVAYGPSQYLTELAAIGLTVPPRPLPASKPDASLTLLPYRYFHLDNEYVPVYNAPGGTGAGINQFMPGFVYISYSDRVDVNGIYYLAKSGGWIPGMGARVSEISAFQGLEFRSTPKNDFGWAYEQIPVKSGPGYNTLETTKQIRPFQVVQIYTSQIVDNVEWYLIGPSEWVEGRKVARVTPNTSPPDGANTTRWIEVNLAEQTLAVYDNKDLVFATVIASGMEPFWTKPGLFQIYEKTEAETMRNNDPSDFYYLEDVPWTMYFDEARALHGAYWRTRFGYPQSHGCVNLSVGDSHWLYNWANVGDWVYVHDPSGLTPIDPSLYGAGGY